MLWLRLFSSTWLSGQMLCISSSLVSRRPPFCTSTWSVSKTLVRSGTGRPSQSSRRSPTSRRNGPNSYTGRASRVVIQKTFRKRPRLLKDGRALPVRCCDAKERSYAKTDARSKFLSHGEDGHRRRARKACLRRHAQSRSKPIRRPRRRRTRRLPKKLRKVHQSGGEARGRRRAAPFWLERLQLVPLSRLSASSYGAALSHRPGPALLSHQRA